MSIVVNVFNVLNVTNTYFQRTLRNVNFRGQIEGLASSDSDHHQVPNHSDSRFKSLKQLDDYFLTQYTYLHS